MNRANLKTLIVFFVLIAGTFTGLKAQTVTLDYYFNREVHDVNGKPVRWHYLWDEKEWSGFMIWGELFKKNGAKLDSLNTRPTLANLKGTSVYIIVDPDTRKESPAPNYIQEEDASQIAAWVKKGGVLVMMANDSVNVELPHFNILAGKFGMHFNSDLQLHVTDDAHFSDGAIDIVNNPVFKTSKRVFLKDVCSISTPANAEVILKSAKTGATIAATVKYGKGTVFAVGDPWLYNEYVNGRLPAEYENDKAASDLAIWLLQQTKNK
ncbi:DUF4350 domain-containing protein [Pedobacter sp. MC2016-14]|uniref:DUF4350 domain-containing protein n=1 Tax=Pedobacter sp. MC2016-14 TaxID=2897327 RepID=UPI001E3F1350|nr:DUF4350 domain-containing protein [Pedobacter sp. MC2016-14]MCD0487885.1 DUF4350 domain-containing protein [Pedobacter sp. MC2016-14]